ncbi:hypothetical protein [Peribacillus simplex]|uniref:hypothetical protein n=1 Tax=Peribacillus simplex TaxID=1478 RepID=UPI0011542001|nr:hypothetical protein [Peribacillus simplex]
MSATIPFGKTFGYWFYKAAKDIVPLPQILHHSHPFVTLRYMDIIEEETSNILNILAFSFLKNKNAVFKTFVLFRTLTMAVQEKRLRSRLCTLRTGVTRIYCANRKF